MKIIAILLFILASSVNAENREIILSSTTSTQNSGLYDYILPMFTKDTGVVVKVVAVGTGQAIRIAQNGDADALLVHHRPSEDLFMKNGFGIVRFDVMYNDFVLIGPKVIRQSLKNSQISLLKLNQQVYFHLFQGEMIVELTKKN